MQQILVSCSLTVDFGGNGNMEGCTLGTGFSGEAKDSMSISTQDPWGQCPYLDKVSLGHKAAAVTIWMGDWRSGFVFWVCGSLSGFCEILERGGCQEPWKV